MREEAGRIACVDLPALPLQLLLCDNPSWRQHPVAVVAEDRPQGEISWINEHARRLRVLPGMRFAAARSLAPRLRAAVVSPERVEQVVGELFTVLCGFSPRVEPGFAPPGVFWLDPGGLSRLYGDLEQWSRAVHAELQGRGFQSSVVVGFSRFRTHAIARTTAGCLVLPGPAREARLAAAVPLDRLSIPPDLRDSLAVLNVRTLGELSALPAEELSARFGAAARRLHDLATDRAFSPLQPRALVDPIVDTLALEPPENDHARLLFRLKSALQGLLDRLAGRGQAMSALHLRLSLDHAGHHDERIEPASPTLDVVQTIDLVRLRLDALALPAGIEEVRIEVEGVRARGDQLALFGTQRRRDLEAGERALARLRAVFGPESVTHARLRAAHLPEARFAWEPLRKLAFARPGEPVDELSLVRRILPRPIPLPEPPRHEPEAWPDLEPGQGALVRLHGPFRVSGGWWVRTVERDYYYAETRRGDLLWVYWDRPRRGWFLHGRVD